MHTSVFVKSGRLAAETAVSGQRPRIVSQDSPGSSADTVAERSVEPPETSARSPKASPAPDAELRRLPERRDDRDREAPFNDQVKRVRRIAAVEDDLKRV
jgi:hypothetical protein